MGLQRDGEEPLTGLEPGVATGGTLDAAVFRLRVILIDGCISDGRIEHENTMRSESCENGYLSGKTMIRGQVKSYQLRWGFIPRRSPTASYREEY